MEQKRIEFVDLAKGITILIIALTHTYGDSGGFALEILSIFKVPTFFALSGLFFSTYDSFNTFIRKKINQLVIPLLFTFVFLSLPWNVLLELHSGGSISINDLIFIPDTYKLNFGMAPGAWFVLCLRLIVLFFYLIYIISRGNMVIISLVALSAGIYGYILNVIDVSLPIWIDTALTSMPFFLMGMVLGRYSGILRSNLSSKWWATLIISTLIFCFSIYLLGDGYIFYAGNRYSVNLICLFIGGWAGVLLVILISKIINKLPIISYIGRYSLIMLLTHQFYLFILRNIVYQLNIQQDSIIVSFMLFLIVVILTIPTILFCKKYLPWAFGLKEVIK